MKKSCEDWLKSQMGDDVDLIREIYTEYVTTAKGLIQQITDLPCEYDPALLDRLLHTLKGTAAMAGDSALSSLAAAARQNSKLDIDALKNNLNQALQEF